MLVCHCLRVFDKSIRDCVRSGAARTADEVGEACGAGTECGGCRDTIEDIVQCESATGYDVSLSALAPRIAA